MKTINQWFEEYESNHKNHTNKSIHFICVPAIFISILGFLFSAKLPFVIFNVQLNLGLIALIAVTVYYLRLSESIAIGIFILSSLSLFLWYLVGSSGIKVWIVASIIFVIAWVGQIVGHSIEKQRPSFFKDIQFLLIGPAWLLSFIYKKLDIKI